MLSDTAPAFYAYTVHTVEGRDVWEKIGAAFPHGQGKGGLNVLFQKLPARDQSGNYKIILRVPKEASTPTGAGAS